MKRLILTFAAGILLWGVNVFAAGDLVVSGTLGVGTDTPGSKLQVVATDVTQAIRASVLLSNTNPGAGTNIGAYYSVNVSETGMTGGKAYIGFQGQVGLTGDGSVYSLQGAENIVFFNSSSVASTITYGIGNTAILRRGSVNTQNHNMENYYGFYSYGGASGSGNISGTDWRHAYFANLPDYGGAVTNVSGLWIDQQTRGNTNYGIVLNGDGAGANIVFGASQQASIYSSSGLLYATDMNGNITQFSPHDPETGEWIYYSKNTKTGVVKRVNMEKLVKAVEKLTGETFMVETLVEDK